MQIYACMRAYRRVHAYMHICADMHICTHICIHAHIFAHICIHKCIYAYMCTYLYEKLTQHLTVAWVSSVDVKYTRQKSRPYLPNSMDICVFVVAHATHGLRNRASSQIRSNCDKTCLPQGSVHRSISSRPVYTCNHMQPSLGGQIVTGFFLYCFISGVAQWLACWAHNTKVCGSKPRSAI